MSFWNHIYIKDPPDDSEQHGQKLTTVLQENINGSSLAHALLLQISTESDADVLILSKSYIVIDSPTWFRSFFRITAHGRGEDFVWAKVTDVPYVSVYLTPNCSDAKFMANIKTLKDAVRDIKDTWYILAKNVNAKAIERDMITTNKHGRLFLEMTAKLDLVMVNTEQVTTCRRPKYEKSIPDVTFVTDRLFPSVRRWRVVDDFTVSDHQYIVFDVTKRTCTWQMADSSF